jgi:Phosphoribosylamine-glycine ligase
MTLQPVVCVSEGYPGAYEKGKPITIKQNPGDQQLVFHAGTQLTTLGADGGLRLVSAGGRVLAVTGFGADLKNAVNNALEGVEMVRFSGKTWRRDIGQDLMHNT